VGNLGKDFGREFDKALARFGQVENGFSKSKNKTCIKSVYMNIQIFAYPNINIS